MDLDLVQLPGPDQGLSRSGAVDHDVPVASTCSGGRSARGDVRVEPRGTGRDVSLVNVVGEHEDGNAVVAGRRFSDRPARTCDGP